MTLPVPSQRTWTTGDIVTAAMMNANVRDAVNFLANPPICIAEQASSQTLANGTTFIPIALDTNIADSYSGHSTTVNNTSYVAQVSGFYFCIGAVAFLAASAGVRGLVFLVNGSQIPYFPHRDAGQAQTQYYEVSAFLYLNAGDHVQLAAFQNSGSSMLLSAGASGLGVLWVHA